MRRFLVIPVIAGLLVTLGACGAKDDTATSSGDNPTTTQPATTSTTDDPASGDDANADTGSDTDSGGGIGDLPPGIDKGCFQVSALMMQSLVLVTPGASSQDFDQLEADIEAAKDDMPAEIADAFDTWSAAWVEFAADMEEINANGGFSNPENVAKIEAANAPMETPEVEAASDQLEQYVDEKCDTGS